MRKAELRLVICTGRGNPLIRDGALRQVVLSDSPIHFHVILENLSQKKLFVWDPLCAAGYDALTFELKDSGGAIHRVRYIADWTGPGSVAAITLLMPGEFIVYNIHFGRYWNLPQWTRERQVDQVRMRAVYTSATENLLAFVAHQQLLAAMRKQNQLLWVGNVATRWEKFSFMKR